MKHNPAIELIKESLKKQLNETAYELIIPNIEQDIKNINDVFAQSFLGRCLNLFDAIVKSDNDNITPVLEPLNKLSENYPYVAVAVESAKRLNHLFTKNAKMIIKTYNLDKITNLPNPDSDEFNSLLNNLQNFTALSIKENVNNLAINKNDSIAR